MKDFTDKDEKTFLITISFLSAIVSVLYIWNGLLEQFYIATYVFIGLHILFIPVVLLFRRTGFIIFTIIYAIVLVFIIAFYKTYLYNNFTGALVMMVAVLVAPKLKKMIFGIYIIAISVAFALNEENLCHYLIHIVRFTLAFYVFDFIMRERYTPKKLILYDDEIKILTELSKNRLQKSIEMDGFSESTIYRRIKAACKRNKMTKADLLDEFKKSFINNQTDK